MIAKQKNGLVPGASSGSASLLDILKTLSGGLAFLLIGRLLLWECQHYDGMPHYDDIFDRLRYFRALGSVSDFFQYLICRHNEHRILTQRLIQIADDYFLHGQEHLQTIFTNGLQILSAYFAWRSYSQENGKFISLEGLWAFLVICLFFINPNFMYNFAVPFQVQHSIMELFCVLTAFLIAREVQPLGPKNFSALLAKLLGLAFIATFTLGNAPVLLITAAVAAVVFRWGGRAVLVLGLFAIGHLVLGVIITGATREGGSLNPLTILHFAALYIGGPFIRSAPYPASYVTYWSSSHIAYVAGSLILVLSVVYPVIRFLRPGFGGRAAAFGFLLLVMVVVTAVAAGHARADLGLDEALSKKYAMFAALGWLGAVMIIAGSLRDVLKPTAWNQAATLLLIFVVVWSFAEMGFGRETRIWQKHNGRTWEAAMAVFVKANDGTRLHDIYAEHNELAYFVEKGIEPRHLEIFGYYPFQLYDPVAGVLAHRAESGCRGEVQRLDRVPTVDLVPVFDVPGMAYIISGWAWMDKSRGPSADILALDVQDRIVGVAHNSRSSSSAEEWLSQKLDGDLGWFGYARTTPPVRLHFVALSGDGKYFCRLTSPDDPNFVAK